MSHSATKTQSAEEFVRDVLKKNFNQAIDQETLRAVADKVSRAVGESSSRKAA